MRVPVIFVALAALLGAGCSGGDQVPTATDAKALAESMIAGELAATVALGPLTPSCNDPGPLAVGTTFTCLASRSTEPPGEPIQIQGAVNSDGHLGLVTLNLISVAALPSFEKAAASQLNGTVGSNFTADSVDCGAAAVVLPADGVLTCALIMPASGQVFDLRLTITDLNARRFGLEVAEEPRA